MQGRELVVGQEADRPAGLGRLDPLARLRGFQKSGTATAGVSAGACPVAAAAGGEGDGEQEAEAREGPPGGAHRPSGGRS